MKGLMHVELLVKMLNDLSQEQDGVELLEYQLHPQAFGSFELVLGRAKQHVKFTWDGKDSILSISLATIQNQNSIAQWVNDANISLPNGEGLYEEIWSECVNLLAI
jgi:hypothetical protein